MKFNIKLTLFVISILVVFSLASYFIMSEIVRTYIENILRDQAEDLSAATMEKLDQDMFERIADVKMIATTYIISSKNSTPEQITNELLFFRDNYMSYISIAVYDTNRTKIADTNRMGIGEQYPHSQLFTDALENGLIVTGYDTGMDDELGVKTINFAAPVRDENGTVFRVAVAKMPITKLHELLPKSAGSISEEEAYQIGIINNKGEIIYSNHHVESRAEDELHKALMRKALAQTESVSINELTDPETGQEEFAILKKEDGYRSFNGNGWTLIFHAPKENVFVMVSGIQNYFIFVFIVAVVLSSVLSLYFSRTITQPIKELHEATEELEKGNYSVRTNIRTGDEIEQLSHTFNKAVERLGAIEEEHNQIDKAKTQFLTITSHELRSPMTPMKAQMQMLKEGYFGKLNKKQLDSLEIAVRNTDRLDKLLADFLEISRIEAARLKFSYGKTNVAKVTGEVVEYMQGFMPERNVRLTLKVEKLPEIQGDADRISQVLRNLISNAIKFSKQEGVVEISAKKQDNFILFSVKDYGAGISPENQQKLFTPFFQVDKTFSREQGGTGLGLAICKGIIEAMGGRIWFESALGKGTTFYFTIPSTPPAEEGQGKIIAMFTTNIQVESELLYLFKEYLGPLGESEFSNLKNAGKTSENALIDYITDLVASHIVTPKTGDIFKKDLSEVFDKIKK